MRESARDSGELVAPSLVFGLEGSELVDGVGPPLRPRPAVLRPLEGPDGLAGGAALAPAALALGVRYAHGSTLPADEPQNSEGQRGRRNHRPDHPPDEAGFEGSRRRGRGQVAEGRRLTKVDYTKRPRKHGGFLASSGQRWNPVAPPW